MFRNRALPALKQFLVGLDACASPSGRPFSESASYFLRQSAAHGPVPMGSPSISQLSRGVHSGRWCASDSVKHNKEWEFMVAQGHNINPCNSKLHPAVTEAGILPSSDKELCVQEAYTPDSACFGCGEWSPVIRSRHRMAICVWVLQLSGGCAPATHLSRCNSEKSWQTTAII